MEIIIYIIVITLLLVGLAGCIVPVLPGPPIAYLGIIVLQMTSKVDFSITTLLMLGLLALGVTILDYIVPGIGTKKFGGSKLGTIGCFIGTIAGLFLFPPIGIVVMPFVGALLGELLNGTPLNPSLRAAIGALIGFLAGTFAKFLVCFIYIGFTIWAIF